MSPKDWEAKKPPRVQHETKHEKRIRLLSGIAQRGSGELTLVLGIIGLSAWIFGTWSFIKAVSTTSPNHEYSHCVEGYKFYYQTQILDAEGRAIRGEGVRSSAGKPLT